MRLFAAVELPDYVKQVLTCRVQGMAGVRWLRPEQLHLTLAFIGDVDANGADLIELALSGIEASSFSLQLDGGGCFPGPERARVLWVGFEQNDALKFLAGRVVESLSECGVGLEQRVFRPHVTLARLRQPDSCRVAEFIRAFQGIEPISFEVNQFVLFQSLLQQSGARHVPVRCYPLVKSGQCL